MTDKKNRCHPLRHSNDSRKLAEHSERDRAMNERYISVDAARARYGLGTTKVYELIASGHIVARKLGRRLLIDAVSADKFFAALPRADLTTGLRRARAAEAAMTRETAA